MSTAQETAPDDAVTVAQTYSLTFDGGILARGFWLYVWEVTTGDGRVLHYVGRTGDSSSRFAQSPYIRMGQHLGAAPNASMLRQHLAKHDVTHGACAYRLVAHGPVLPEAADMVEHRRCRDIVAALEKALAEAMTNAGYLVMNTVSCRKPLDSHLFETVRQAFAAEFPRLADSREE